jgi:hypothetical protein
MRDHKICVVEISIERGLGKNRAGEPTGNEQRYEAGGKQQRRGIANSSTVKRCYPIECLDG